MENFVIERNTQLIPTEVENLRTAIGWDSNKGKYKEAFKNTYAQFSIKKDSELIAYGRIVSDRIIYAFIVDLMIHPNYQRKGLGKKFIEHIVNELKKDKIKYIQLTFDSELETFYKNCGFEIIEAGSILNE